MNVPKQIAPRRAGFSLVELMVALVISLVLIGGVLKIYLGSKQAYRVQDNQARLQENGRMALYFLTHDLRMAGYMGCNRLSQITPNIIADAPVPVFDASDVIQGYDSAPATWPTDLPIAPPNYVPNTDAVVVRFAAPYSGVYLTGNMSANDANIQINAKPATLQQGDVLFLSDCSSADIFRATSVSNGTGGIVTIAHANNQNTSNKLSAAYTTDAQLMSYKAVLYYLGTTATPGVYGLYRIRSDSSNAPEELVDGVAAMQLLYGVDTSGDGSANEYLTASQVNAISPPTAGWPDVVSVRVNLLLDTPEDHLTRTVQVYRFAGSSVTASDHRLYASFGDTVTLRNRTP